MRLSKSFFYTIREDIKDEDSISSELLVRSGMIKKTSSGIYMYMPMGFKVLKNIEKIIREEMNKVGCNELLMPSLIYEDFYVKSGRKEKFGNSVFTLKDRAYKPYVLGPTHEELFAVAANMKIRSYKDMPISMYQFQNKFRDEARPRYGLIRVREFTMKDAYSFDSDLESLDIAYQKMYQAYKNSFDRIGLKYLIVKADTGVMGGLLSEEFQAITEIGEDKLIFCSQCTFSSNIEVAPIKYHCETNQEALEQLQMVDTPNQKTIEEVSNYLKIDPKKTVKALIYKINNELMMFLLRGDRTLNEVKVSKHFNDAEVIPATEEEINQITVLGYIGPIDSKIKVIIDEEVKYMTNYVIGANAKDKHYINANLKDYQYSECFDLRNIEENDPCPLCGNSIKFTKGIEIGNTFKLGTKYSECFNLNYLNKENKLMPVYMGSYGIGIGRCMAAIVEQNNDDKGIIWPISIAPYQVSIVVIDVNNSAQMMSAEKLYQELIANHIDVLFDDRDVRAGVKFNDSDLIGIPIRITIGKKIEKELVELKLRQNDFSEDINISQSLLEIKKYL